MFFIVLTFIDQSTKTLLEIPNIYFLILEKLEHYLHVNLASEAAGELFCKNTSNFPGEPKMVQEFGTNFRGKAKFTRTHFQDSFLKILQEHYN